MAIEFAAALVHQSPGVMKFAFLFGERFGLLVGLAADRFHFGPAVTKVRLPEEKRLAKFTDLRLPLDQLLAEFRNGLAMFHAAHVQSAFAIGQPFGFGLELLADTFQALATLPREGMQFVQLTP
jgi:hypothetical protein